MWKLMFENTIFSTILDCRLSFEYSFRTAISDENLLSSKIFICHDTRTYATILRPFLGYQRFRKFFFSEIIFVLCHKQWEWRYIFSTRRHRDSCTSVCWHNRTDTNRERCVDSLYPGFNFYSVFKTNSNRGFSLNTISGVYLHELHEFSLAHRLS